MDGMLTEHRSRGIKLIKPEHNVQCSLLSAAASLFGRFKASPVWPSGEKMKDENWVRSAEREWH